MPIAATAASQLLQHISRKRLPASPLPLPPPLAPSCLRLFAALNQTTTGFAHYAEYGGMEGRTESEYRLFRAATYAFFTNIARWKFPYENRLVEIS